MKYSSKIHILRIIIGTSGMLTMPVIILMALLNPLLKDYFIFWISASINIILLSWFMAENLDRSIIDA